MVTNTDFGNESFTWCVLTSFERYSSKLVFYYKTIFELPPDRSLIDELVQLFLSLKQRKLNRSDTIALIFSTWIFIYFIDRYLNFVGNLFCVYNTFQVINYNLPDGWVLCSKWLFRISKACGVKDVLRLRFFEDSIPMNSVSNPWPFL